MNQIAPEPCRSHRNRPKQVQIGGRQFPRLGHARPLAQGPVPLPSVDSCSIPPSHPRNPRHPRLKNLSAGLTLLFPLLTRIFQFRCQGTWWCEAAKEQGGARWGEAPAESVEPSSLPQFSQGSFLGVSRRPIHSVSSHFFPHFPFRGRRSFRRLPSLPTFSASQAVHFPLLPPFPHFFSRKIFADPENPISFTRSTNSTSDFQTQLSPTLSEEIILRTS